MRYSLKCSFFGKYNIVQHGIVHVEIILKLKILNIIALNVIYFSCNAKKNCVEMAKANTSIRKHNFVIQK